MKIAIVYPSLRTVGGAENVVVWLAESLVERGHSVIVFTRAYSEDVWGNRADRTFAIHLLAFKQYRSTFKTNRMAGAELKEAFKQYEFDIINPHNYPANLWVYYAKHGERTFPKVLLYMEEPPRNFYERITDRHVRKIPGLRSIWSKYRPKKMLRNLRQSLFGYRRLDREAVHQCDRVLANSNYTAAVAREIYGTDIIACPLGIPVERFSRIDQTNTNCEAKGTNVTSFALTVARIERAKNFDTILKAARLLKNSGQVPSGFRYKIAGKGPYLKHFRKKCRSAKLDDMVEFLGFVPDEEMQRLLKETLFLVHIPLDEPFGLVPLEAALFRRPSIVSNHGGPSETVVNGFTGLHVDALDPRDVAEKMASLLNQPVQARAIGEAAYLWLMKNMTWDVFMNNFENHLRETVHKR